ncbi:Glycosyl hydrolases family 2, TIM barrel domain [Filimonas lacunae]|uniref:Glycosyl hydrolases family 2, TIM barrel domain n=1 Tax=Filimonas lacunae TaxID=477680 RepID=A0A173MJM2_9BACT|nr:glycoside hydrolase family 2 [Filimonas lacunae]BAV07687.1 beta-galactosidase [Filimonas lacunae]SIT03526.1 Glycosyl hydrolases family 2, TIM barrel domain [Filimonas lacunae]
MKRIVLSLTCLLHAYYGMTQEQWKLQPVSVTTRWAKQVTPQNVLPEYPRPQLVRSKWTNLNGLWEYAITDSTVASVTKYDGQILVPYPLESALSGVKRSLQPDQKLWYRREVTIADKKPGMRYLLHFGAVDYSTVVICNGKEAGRHKGGFQEFTVEVTALLQKGNNTIGVAVLDPTDKGNNPKGKQVLNPRGIMYTPTSGIWQTVWLEEVPEVFVSKLKILPDVDKQLLQVWVTADGKMDKYQAEVSVWADGKEVSKQTGNGDAAFLLPIANPHLWSPQNPFLYDVQVRLLKNGKPVDEVKSYAGMRKVEIKKDAEGQERIFLNNQYVFQLGVLDQGFWPDGLFTAPTDEALAWDVVTIKSMGFNTIRKHIKIEPARWYYHCDKLGMLVWQDMPYPANVSDEAKNEFERENNENIAQLYNYPCIVSWVLFNEGWNRYDQERLTGWMKRKDPSRIINGHSGENYDKNSPANPDEKWINSDLTDVHVYPGPGQAPQLPGKARVLGEWGGVRVATPGHQWNGEKSWGYIETTAASFATKYSFMMRHLKLFEEEGLSAAIYTQPFDVEIEENGLVTYDREVIKIPVDKMKEINSILFKK